MEGLNQQIILQKLLFAIYAQSHMVKYTHLTIFRSILAQKHNYFYI